MSSFKTCFKCQTAYYDTENHVCGGEAMVARIQTLEYEIANLWTCIEALQAELKRMKTGQEIVVDIGTTIEQ